MSEMEPRYKRFKKNAELVSAYVSSVKSISDVFEYVKKLLAESHDNSSEKTVAAPGFSDEELSVLEKILEEKNTCIFGKDLHNQNERIDIGITYADYGIAETGTLVVDSKHHDIRLATMLSNYHVAVVPYSKLRDSTEELLPEFNKILENEAGYLAFITGASRTADIERILVTGVHGPLELHILVLEDNEDDTL